MRNHRLQILFLLLIPVAGVQAGEARVPPAEVVAALAYVLPANTCKAPKLSGGNWSTTNPSDGATEYYDLDYAEQRRYQRALKRYDKCLRDYKSGLQDDFAALKGSAQHGLTNDEATTIMGHMALIGEVLAANDGLPAAQDAPSDNRLSTGS